jgi:succinate dehydrogenase / fumarate reductase flavoprotein subunit
LGIQGAKTVDHFHRRLGKVMWDKVGMSRDEEGLKWAVAEIQKIRSEFYSNVRIPGTADEFNPELDKANRVADFLELGELMAIDALNRTESCGGHFREESQTPDGEAKRNDTDFAYVAAWEYSGNVSEPTLHKEELVFENIKLVERNYK